MTAEARFTLQTALAGLDIQVRIRGELDVTAAPELARALDSLRGSGRGGLVLHLDEVEFIDCACARVIARAASTWPLPGRAVIQAASPAVRRVFQLTSLAAAAGMDRPVVPPPPRNAPIPAQGEPATRETPLAGQARP